LSGVRKTMVGNVERKMVILFDLWETTNKDSTLIVKSLTLKKIPK
jgi:hypothetical protein